MELTLPHTTTPTRLRTSAPTPGYALPREDSPWLAAEPGVAYRIVHIDLRKNAYSYLLRLAPGASAPQRYRTQPALARVIEGRCAWRERGWRAEVGGTVYEAAGEVNTPANPGDAPLMLLVHATGPSVIVDDDGRQLRYDDAFTMRDAAIAALHAQGADVECLERITR